MKQEVLIKAEGVSKTFCKDLKTSLKYGILDIWTEILGKQKNREALRPKEFWAVDNISFEVKRGECLGLIGHNGAGKSTLLKMLNGLINLDRGQIEMRGRVGALIELGAGFSPILTGRENIYINASILGFSKKEIEAKFDDIVNFSEIGDFIDTPVQNYSSGMKVRLGFAIAAQMEPDILIIDEVLAVGDTGFKIKCINRIAELKDKCAIIFVSHSMPQLARICNKAIFMVKGKMEYQGDNLTEAIEAYYNSFSVVETGIDQEVKNVVINKLLINDSSSIASINHNSDLNLTIDFSNVSGKKVSSFSCIIVDNDYKSVASSIYVFEKKEDYIDIEMVFTIPNLQLGLGTYYLSFQFFEDMGTDSRGAVLANYTNIGQFKITHSPSVTAASFQLLNNVKFLNYE
ncbi:ABC transporter ATP-binding protein [Crocinitomix sp.]|nr:ABC transporter ATP-binding protein [Crocinitomix sp.]